MIAAPGYVVFLYGKYDAENILFIFIACYSLNDIGMNENIDITIFNNLFRNYKNRFVHFARTYVDDEMMAEDIAVESLMYYWENRKKLDAHSNIPAYVLTVVKHKCLDHLRRLRTQEDFAEYLQSSETRKLKLRIATLEACNPERIFSDELQRLLDKTLDTLPEQTREIFIRSRYDNQSHKQIAEALGITTKAVEFHITKALKVFRVSLKDYLPLLLYFLMKQ